MLTNKHQLKNKIINNYYAYCTAVINLLQRLHGQASRFDNFIFALKISSDAESFTFMGTFWHNWLAPNVIASPLKRTDRGLLEPNKEFPQNLWGFFQRIKLPVINSREILITNTYVNTYRLLSWGDWCRFYGMTNHEIILVVC